MRSIWVTVSSFAVIAALGGTAYYVSRQETYMASLNPDALQKPQAKTVLAGNPLLTANIGQFDRWVPSYPINCGQILYETLDTNLRHHSLCIREIRSRVAAYTMQEVSRNDVLDPLVRARWHKVMKEDQ